MEKLVEEHLPGQNQYEILRRNILIVLRMIMTLSLLIPVHTWIVPAQRSGGQRFAAYPYPTSQVDFHSTLKYLTRLPEMLEQWRRKA